MSHSVPIDRSRWSPSSQRSAGGHYDARATHYEGIAYRCRVCEASCVFSPEAQKTAYEVEEKFVDWLQAFCEACQAKRALLIGQHKAYQERWATGRAELLKDIRFLEDWRSVLRELRAYGKADESLEGMLSKLIRES